MGESVPDALPSWADIGQLAQWHGWNPRRVGFSECPVCFQQERGQKVHGKPVAPPDAIGWHHLNSEVFLVLSYLAAGPLNPRSSVQRFHRRRWVSGQIHHPCRRLGPSPFHRRQINSTSPMLVFLREEICGQGRES